MRSWVKLTVIAALLLTAPSAAYPADFKDCFLRRIESVEEEARLISVAASHERLMELVKQGDVPTFMKRFGNHEIPVILVNDSTFPALAPFLSESMGPQVQLQPDWRNDHGMLRVGTTMIDVDTPGFRGHGELHATGIAWKNMYSYMGRRGPEHPVVLEVAYPLSVGEQRVAAYYQRVRRAAIFRVPFTFGGGGARPYPNLLTSGGEHCFLFCKGSSIASQVSEIQNRLRALGIEDIDALMGDRLVDQYIRRFEERILAASPNDPVALSSRALISTPRDTAAFSRHLKPGVDPAELAGWVISLDASIRYRRVLDSLRVTSDLAIADAANPRAVAVLVYDHSGRNDEFRDGSYATDGKFYQWRKDGQRSLGKADHYSSPVRELVAAGFDPAVAKRMLRFAPGLPERIRALPADQAKMQVVYRGISITPSEYNPSKLDSPILQRGDLFAAEEVLTAVSYAVQGPETKARYVGIVLELEVPSAAMKPLDDRFYPNVRLDRELLPDDRAVIRRVGLIDGKRSPQDRRSEKAIRWVDFDQFFRKDGSIRAEFLKSR